MQLSSHWIEVQCEPERGVWSIRSQAGYPAIRDAGLQVVYRSHKRLWNLIHQPWSIASVSGPELLQSRQGPIQQLVFTLQPDSQDMQTSFEIAVALEHPFLTWRMSCQNLGRFPVNIERIEMLNSRQVSLDEQTGEKAFFSNGWQSWSFTGVYGENQVQRRSRFGLLLNPMAKNASTPVPSRAGHYTSDFFGVLGDRTHRAGILVGFLSQKENFGAVEAFTCEPAGLRLWASGDGARLDPGRTVTTDWAVLQFLSLDDPDPLGEYCEAVRREHELEDRSSSEIPTGWCSWYEFYQNIDERKIRENLQIVDRLKPDIPLSLVQIDDGFERQPGDWFEFRKGFPDGVRSLSQEIRVRGFTPGLWLAPFIVHPRANLARNHSEYLLRTSPGRPVFAGFAWNAYTYALDLTHPGALEYVCRAIETASQAWGYPYLKLDFLYAAALPGKHHDPTQTRAQVLRKGLEAVRSAAGSETYLLGCGVPLGSSIGIFQGMRIGTDVSGQWEPSYSCFDSLIKQEPHIPATRNALQNILSRAPMHARWWTNDPDCLIVRPTAGLTLAEIQTLATAIGLSGGSLLLSDNLPALPEERLRIAQVLLPLIGRRPQLLDWFDSPTPSLVRLDLNGPQGSWNLLAAFNWSDNEGEIRIQPERFRLPAGDYLAISFWDQKKIDASLGEFALSHIPPHGAALLAVRPYLQAQPQYAGSDLHISQGMEVSGWETSPSGLRVNFTLPRKAEGQVWLRFPHTPQKAHLDGISMTWSEEGDIYRFPVSINRSGLLEVEW